MFHKPLPAPTTPLRSHSLRLLPCAAALLCGLSFIYGCGSDAPPTGGTVSNRDSLPVMVTRGVSKLISDSGVIRYKIIAEEWHVFDKTTPPRWEFPKGIFIERYDDKFRINLHITADSAWLYDQKLWKLRGHIVLDDQTDGSHLTTEELFWNMNTGELSSNVYTRLVQPDQQIEGDWFRAVVRNGRPTQYHVRQSRGFMPMGDTGQPAPAPNAPTDTTLRADTLPPRPAPVSRPRRP